MPREPYTRRDKILGGIIGVLFLALLFSLSYAVHGFWRYMEWEEESKPSALESYISDPVRIAKTEKAISGHHLFLGMRESDARKSIGAPHKEIRILENDSFLTIWIQTASSDSPVVVFRYGVIQQIQ